ncbi:TolC family outer membrane protein [Wenzhouxiangella limi]|uniref:TolC family outer membrane protein n=1 Tax=Wenzhouxiangella limi TaxID=2707351 RepID=A0A845UYY6_9GAMM|nr:TolC family outer membrane protein [Wenzhouxiangella limi]NDY95492.1 TolC family outer membrane protein [Wenzhouxiangella limi]
MKDTSNPSKKHRFFNKLLVVCSFVLAPTTVALAQTSAEDVVLQAIEKNPDVQVRWHDFRAAGFEEDAARGGFRPQIGIDAAYGRQRDNFITGNPMNTGFAEIGLTQLLWDGGRTGANVEEFDNIQLVRYFELLDSAEQTAVEAMRAYLDVVRFRELVQLARDNLETHQQVYDQVAESVEAGVARAADLEQINGRLALAEANLITEESNLHDVSARYLRIIGDLPPDELREVTLDANLPDNIHDVLMQAYQHNPKYHAALRNISAAGSAIRAQRAERTPRLNLTAAYGVQTRDEFGERENHTDGRIGVELTYDLYTGGRRSSNIDRAVALESSAISLRDRACVDIRQDAQIAFSDVRRISERLPVLNQHRLSSDRVRTAYRQQFDIGERTLLDVLDSENEFFEASRAWTSASYDQTLATVRTLGAMGLLLETLSLHRSDLPSLDDLGAEPIEVDPATACPLPPGARALYASQPVVEEEPMVITQVTLSDQATFALDSADLLPAARETLSELVVAIREGKLVGQIQVTGHTCDLGPAAYNKSLSERRAQAVVDYLRSAGIGEDEITSEGRGENDPLYPNDSEENRKRNRRVEITFVTEQATNDELEMNPDGPVTNLRQEELPSVSASDIDFILDQFGQDSLAATPTKADQLAPDVQVQASQPAPADQRDHSSLSGLNAANSTSTVVQIASFSVEANAQRLAKDLQADDYDAFVHMTEVKEMPIWAVRVRALPGQQVAILKEELRDRTGLEVLIVPRSA